MGLTYVQVKNLARLTTRLFYAESIELGNMTPGRTPIDLIADLSRRLLEINPNCSVALRYLAFALMNEAFFDKRDLKLTQSKAVPIKEMTQDEMESLIIKLFEKSARLEPQDKVAKEMLVYLKTRSNSSLPPEQEGDGTFSISEALTLYKNLEQYYAKAYDYRQFSIRADNLLSFEQAIEYLLKSDHSNYLEDEYIKEECRLKLSGKLGKTAEILLSNPKMAISMRLLENTKWADQDIKTVNRYELIATYCRFALKLDYENICAMDTLLGCLKKGVPIEKIDLARTRFSKQPIDALPHAILFSCLQIKREEVNTKIVRQTKEFLAESKSHSIVDKQAQFTPFYFQTQETPGESRQGELDNLPLIQRVLGTLY